MSERTVTAKIGLPYRYTARVYESIGGLVWRYPGWRFQIYEHWAGVASRYGGRSKLYPDRESAEAAANGRLDLLGADPEGDPLTEKDS